MVQSSMCTFTTETALPKKTSPLARGATNSELIVHLLCDLRSAVGAIVLLRPLLDLLDNIRPDRRLLAEVGLVREGIEPTR